MPSKIENFWARARRAFLDTIFPLHCASCGREGEWWCADCRPATVEAFNFCPVCASVFVDKPVCSCLHESLSATRALLYYSDFSVAGNLIRLYKYRFAHSIEEVWFELINKASLPDVWQDFYIIPVPLHLRRTRERGFNQSESIARFVGQKIKRPVISGLGRARYTVQQAHLGKTERGRNVQNAFIWTSDSPSPENILLIDDVYTTGATLSECAKVLLQNGTRRVESFTLFHG